MNIILAIPTSILGTFIILQMLGFTQNTFTLLGLTLVVGRGRRRHHGVGKHRSAPGNGRTPGAGAILGSREIYFAAMATSVAILAIFVPVVFIKGVIGKYFFSSA
jgi:multidrug efflux pump